MRDMEEERERENVAMTQFAHVETELGNGSVIKSGWSKNIFKLAIFLCLQA